MWKRNRFAFHKEKKNGWSFFLTLVLLKINAILELTCYCHNICNQSEFSMQTSKPVWLTFLIQNILLIMGDFTYLNLTKSIKLTKSYKITKTTTAHLSNDYCNSVVKYCIGGYCNIVNNGYNFFQWSFTFIFSVFNFNLNVCDRMCFATFMLIKLLTKCGLHGLITFLSVWLLVVLVL